MTKTRVGFIGLGRMGSAMAERLVTAGADVVVCDSDPVRTKSFASEGAAIAPTARTVADLAPVVFSCLPSVEASRAVALDRDGVAGGAAVRVYVDTATIGVGAARDIAAGLPESIAFLDAPVSGGPNGARAGTLCAIVSGAPAAFDLAAPFLHMMAGRVFHVGHEAGQAQLSKLINNHLSTAGRLAAFEGLVLAMKAGIDPAALVEVINASTGRNHTTSNKIPAAIASGEFAYGAALANSVKDETLLQDEAARLGVPLWVAPRLLDILKDAAAAGYLHRDSMQLIELMGEKAGIDARTIMEKHRPMEPKK